MPLFNYKEGWGQHMPRVVISGHLLGLFVGLPSLSFHVSTLSALVSSMARPSFGYSLNMSRREKECHVSPGLSFALLRSNLGTAGFSIVVSSRRYRNFYPRGATSCALFKPSLQARPTLGVCFLSQITFVIRFYPSIFLCILFLFPW